jgi:hypothetical protein
MKRSIKITKEQAKMLKEINKKPMKVVKISQEQYNRLFQETEDLNEFMSAANSIKRNFKNSLSKQTKKDISKLKESYSAFIKELYSLKEGEGGYDELIKLMEVKGMINNRKISKEYFLDNKDVVMEVICSGLNELEKGCSNYEAMEVMEGKLAEVTTAASSGAYTGLFSPISFKPNVALTEEDEIDEATTTASVGGSYATPAFLPSKFWGNAGKKGKAPVNKGVTHQNTTWKGGKFVKVKDKCRTFPYCNQGADAIELYGE